MKLSNNIKNINTLVQLLCHWELYITSEQTRIILIDLFDNLLNILEHNPQIKNIQFGGQTVLFTEYLKFRPDKSKIIKKFLDQQKLIIGPWYVSPNLSLVSGEALIRNLIFGHKIYKKFQPSTAFGFITTPFKNTLQLSQVFRDFDIDNIIIWRSNDETQNKNQVLCGPDGSKLFITKLQSSNADFSKIPDSISKNLKKWEDFLNSHILNLSIEHSHYQQRSDHLFQFTHNPQIKNKYPIFTNNNLVFDNLKERVKQHRKSKNQIMADHDELQIRIYDVPEYKTAYSNRLYLKQMNHKCQTLLERYAEPLNAIATLFSYPSQKELIETAWKYLLQNHANHSISGCSIDSVHREMIIRFEKCEQIAKHIVFDCLSHIVNSPQNDEHDNKFCIFNPSPYSRSEIVNVDIFFPATQISNNNMKMKLPEFQIRDSQNNIISYQVQTYNINESSSKHHQNKYKKQRISLLIDTKNLLPFSLTGYTILKSPSSQNQPENSNGIQVGRFFIENRFVRIEVFKSGNIKIIDKNNKNTYENINIFENTGDVGDGFHYKSPVENRPYYSCKFKPRLSIVEQGPLRGAIRIRFRMKIPEEAAKDGQRRSKKHGVLKLSSIVYLEYNSPVVYFETTVLNNIKDHRLRVLFQTGIQSKISYTESAFHIMERKHLSDHQHQDSPDSYPIQRFMTVHDNNKGFTIFSQGLPEIEINQKSGGMLALTLLRCINKLSFEDTIKNAVKNPALEIFTPGAQCEGQHIYRYAIFPHSHDLQQHRTGINNFAEAFNVKLVPIFQTVVSEEFNNNSILKVTPGELRLSSFKECETSDGHILRLYNASGENITGYITPGFPYRKIFVSNLREETVSEINNSKNTSITLNFKPWQIKTIKFM